MMRTFLISESENDRVNAFVNLTHTLEEEMLKNAKGMLVFYKA